VRAQQPEFHHIADTLARAVTSFVGSSAAFLVALATVIIWAALGPFFHYSDTWQLVW